MKAPPKRPTRQVGMSSGEKARMVVMGIALLAMILVVWRSISPSPAPSPTQPDGATPSPAQVVLPPIDYDLLSDVADGNRSERVVLEPEPFHHLSRASLGLLQSHITELGEPTFPFAAVTGGTADRNSLRGQPFLLRGELLDARVVTRSADAKAEYWCRLRDDNGREYHFVSIRIPEQIFSDQNFVRTDGYFYKLYEEKREDAWHTAPLFVGPRLTPSWRALPAVSEFPTEAVALARDDRLGMVGEPDARALWPLLGYARWLADLQPDQLTAAFAKAEELNSAAFEEVATDPDRFRGKPFRIYAKVVDGWTASAGENPLRVGRVARAWIGNTGWRGSPALVVAPASLRLQTGSSLVLDGWFLQLMGYEAQDTLRRAPVFVVAAAAPNTGAPALWADQLLLGAAIAASATVMLIGFLILRDRRMQAAAAQRSTERRERRKQARAGTVE